jgi:hypothetical protein
LCHDEDAAKRCRGLVKGERKRGLVDNVAIETLPFDTTRAPPPPCLRPPDVSDIRQANPAFWAPLVVGEGAAVK